MMALQTIKQLLNESVSVNDVNDAIDNHRRVIINYRSKGEDIATGSRVIEVVAYGLTKAGNPVIRAFQPFGDTTTKIPSWKFFRLDRITTWRKTKQVFTHPASFYYKNIGKFNEFGDETMSVVYKIASFGDDIKLPDNGPKLKSDNNANVFKTDTEHKLERLRQQLNNPIKLSDLKKQIFNGTSNTNKESGPRLKTDNNTDKEEQENLYKTDTERGLDNLKKQLENPRKIDLSKFTNQKDPVNFKELKDEIQNSKIDNLSNKEEQENLYKTDTERGLDNLKKQLENPRKIDMSKFKRK